MRSRIVFACFVISGAVVGVPVAASAAGRYASVESSEDGTQLTLLRNDGRRLVAPQAESIDDGDGPTHQAGFDRPAISADGSAVGWLAMYRSAFVSYAIPRKLVVLDRHGHRHEFQDYRAIFEWCFPDRDGRRVTTRDAALHGTTSDHFVLWRVSDGARLAEYEVPPEYFQESDGSDPGLVLNRRDILAAIRNMPAWARCAAEKASFT